MKINFRDKNLLIGLLVAIVFVGIGAMLLLQSHAATPAIALEPERGTLTSGARTVNDLMASGGGAVKFVGTNPGTGLSISGNQFLLNGNNFTPEGLISVELLDTHGYVGGCSNGDTTAAKNNFGPAELANLKSKWHANTVRIHVSQPVLAGTDGAAYASHVETDINTIRSAGLVAIISMQNESWACGPADPLPSQQTETAWNVLLSNTNLKNDHDVMFEIYNEPHGNPDTAGWNQWKSGGNSPIAFNAVGHQAMVNYLRQHGVTGIIVADGVHLAGHLDGVPTLSDPGGNNQIAYAVHPLWYGDGLSGWRTRWGNVATTKPVIADAWTCGGSQQNLTSQQTSQFLAYNKDTVHVGLIGYAMDNFSFSAFTRNTALDPTPCGQQYINEYGNYF